MIKRQRAKYGHMKTSANQGKEFPQKHTPKSGVFLFWLLPCSANIWSAVDFSVQLIQKEPEELLCILLTALKHRDTASLSTLSSSRKYIEIVSKFLFDFVLIHSYFLHFIHCLAFSVAKLESNSLYVCIPIK